MEFNSILNVFFKIAAIILVLIYLLYAFVVSKQIKIMTKTLEDKFNWLMVFIGSLQITLGLILLIFVIFFA